MPSGCLARAPAVGRTTFVRALQVLEAAGFTPVVLLILAVDERKLTMKRVEYRRHLLHIALGASACALLIGWLLASRPAANPVVAAWQRARAAGAYHFDSDVVQVTTPAATIANVGRRAREDRLRLEGSTNLYDHTLELTLWSKGGSVLQEETGSRCASRRARP